MQVTETISSNRQPHVGSTASLEEAAFASTATVSRSTEQRRERTREQILEAAHAALIRIGYENITTRRIAEEAGVNVATLHYYFGTKEALLSETVRHALQATEGRLRAAIADAPDGPTALEQLFRALWAMVRERAGVLRYDLAVRGMRDAAARQGANALYGAFRTLAEEVVALHLRSGGTLAPGVTVPLLSHYLVATVDGVILQHKLNGDDALAMASLNLIKQNALEIMGSRHLSPLSVLGAPDKPADTSGVEENIE